MAWHGVPPDFQKAILENFSKDFQDAFEEEFIKQLTDPQVSAAVRSVAHELVQEFNGIVLAYRENYDVIKYNWKLPISDAKFESHVHKWQFIELAKHWEDPRNRNRTKLAYTDYKLFLIWMYGEGYKEPKSHDIKWISDVRSDTGIVDVFQNWRLEKDIRYDILQENLQAMRDKYDLNKLEDFKKFITVENQVEPQMWHAISYTPEVRGHTVVRLQSFILLDSYLHLLDAWNSKLQGEPQWDHYYKRISTYRKLYASMYPINSMTVRKTINETLKFP